MSVFTVFRICSATLAMMLALFSPGAHCSVVYQTAGGKLIGATGVEVGGVAYNVRFVGGTCADAYGVCSDSAFTFSGGYGNQSYAAAVALRDTVFTGLYADRRNIAGCDVGFGVDCYAYESS